MYIATMVLQYLALLLLACSAISALHTHSEVSSYCLVWKFLSSPQPPVSCCNEQPGCIGYVGLAREELSLPGYGRWPPRACHCEFRMWKCLRAGLTDPVHIENATKAMDEIKCDVHQTIPWGPDSYVVDAKSMKLKNYIKKYHKDELRGPRNEGNTTGNSPA